MSLQVAALSPKPCIPTYHQRPLRLCVLAVDKQAPSPSVLTYPARKRQGFSQFSGLPPITRA